MKHPKGATTPFLSNREPRGLWPQAQGFDIIPHHPMAARTQERGNFIARTSNSSVQRSQRMTQKAISKDKMPNDRVNSIKVAAVQASSIFLDRSATTEKTCSLIRRAGSQNARIVGFPEAFIPGYPGWVEMLPLHTEQSASLYLKLFNESVEVPGPETTAIAEACKAANIYAVVGINERRPNTTGTLFNTTLFFAPDGSIVHKHQKYVPTFGERVVHAPGRTGSKASIVTGFGGLSSLICGENGNPLAHYAVGLDYPVVHVASWPGHFAEGMDVNDAIGLYGAAVAASLGCFVVHAVGIVGDDAIQAYGIDEKAKRYLKEQQRQVRACVMGPEGRTLARGTEGEDLLIVDICLDEPVKAKYGFDFAGHYNRPEIFAHLFKGESVQEPFDNHRSK